MRSRNSALLVLLLAACAPVREAPPPPPVPRPQVTPAPVPAGRYEVLPGDGRLTVKAYRAGALAALGHNHVITSGAVLGEVEVSEDPLASTAKFVLAVETFEVDSPAARAEAGPDFTATTPSEADIAGTRANMMGARLLNAPEFPRIEAGFVVESVERDVTRGRLVVRLAGREALIPVQGYVTREDGGVRIRAKLEVTHADLRLSPFSVMGGALRVADALEIEVSLLANRRSPPPD